MKILLLSHRIHPTSSLISHEQIGESSAAEVSTLIDRRGDPKAVLHYFIGTTNLLPIYVLTYFWICFAMPPQLLDLHNFGSGLDSLPQKIRQQLYMLPFLCGYNL